MVPEVDGASATIRSMQYENGKVARLVKLACQSACMGLVRRWQFQLNMKALSAEVMSVLGASFLLQRSCSEERITCRSHHDMRKCHTGNRPPDATCLLVKWQNTSPSASVHLRGM